MDDLNVITIFEGSIWEASLLKEMLLSNEIQAFIENEYMSSIAPWTISSGGFGSAKVAIANKDYDLAIVLLEEFKKQLSDENPDSLLET